MTGKPQQTRRAVVALVSLYAAVAIAASDLDRPITPQQPTVRSEIYRGTQALDCRYASVDDCLARVQNENVQNNTSSDAFNAGLYFTAWMLTSIRVSSERTVVGSSDAGPDAARFFRKMKEYQGKIRIDNAALCEATKTVCKVVLQDMAGYESGARTR